jgi:diaminohydroxyphosphoribosylaminopyrimidine deaminase/5-amino-6-(5-phosphoribosylamino)uracil reductase
MNDWSWMQRSLELAERGRGFVEPNPLVGAVVVRGGQIVGEGWHQHYGQAHAEVIALEAAGEAAHGATLYVTLEPCCHHGKTPPCTDAVVRAGVRRVVAALRDPFPEVAGQGAARLQAAGVVVEMGLAEAEARRQNAPYLKLLATRRPYVHAKWAMSLDGKIATRTGDSKWISSELSRQRVHALRGRMDALVVGFGTVQADDPLLTARPAGPRTPVRVVLCHGRLPAASSQLVQTARATPLLIATTEGLDSPRAKELSALGCELLSLPRADNVTVVRALLDELGRRKMTNTLVEGGAQVLGSFIDADALDEIHVFVAPLLVGGSAALTPAGGQGVAKIAAAVALVEWSVEPSGPDFLIHGWRSVKSV